MTPPPAEKVAEPFTDIVFAAQTPAQGPDDMVFVEVEDHTGKSIKFGEWVKRPDGYWALRFAAAPAPSGAQSEREAFEAWMNGTGFLLKRHDDGDYMSIHTERMWRAWQARASAGSAMVDAWQPMSTAPKDGTPLLLGFNDDDGNWCAIGGWFETAPNDECWYDIYHGAVWPVAWTPYPSLHTHSAPLALTEEETAFMKALDGFMANQGDPWQNFKIVGLKAIITRLTS